MSSRGVAGATWGVTEAKGIGERGKAGQDSSVHLAWMPVLARVPLFQTLAKRHLRRVAGLARLKRFSAGEQLVRSGAPGDALFVILDGSAQVVPANGRSRRLGEGDYFGELALLDGAPRSATVTATDGLTTAVIARTAFLKLLREEPAIGVGLAKGLVAIVRDLQNE